MKADIKKKWVAALRIGEYKQGLARLATGDRFCCLGVLCELSKIPYNPENGYPDLNVREWAGIDPLPIVNYKGEKRKLTWLNDSLRLSFTEIADLIEAQL